MVADLVIRTGARKALFIDSTDDIDISLVHQDENGNPVDLTGFDVEWTFTIGGVTLTATSAPLGGITVDALNGVITLHFEANADDGGTPTPQVLPQGLGEHRLRFTDPVVKTLMRGALVNDT